VPEYPGVSALGDCVHFENTRTGEIVLPRAHHAVRQARVVAHNILAEIRGWDKEAYDFKNDTEIVSLGSSDAIFRYRRLEVRGFLARLIWIAGYTLLINGAYNRVRILTDWIIFLLFGRDTTLLKLKR
jgi:NADH dehydrogenase